MQFRRLLFGALLSLTLGGIVAAWWIWQPGQNSGPPKPRRTVAARAEKPPTPGQAYVGSATCATCHAEIAESYSHHPMSSSFGPLSTDAPYFEDALLQPDGMCSYTVKTENGRMTHHEILRDSAGELIYDQPAPIDYAIGSGARGWSFLIARGDMLFMSPLTWYSSAEKWDLSPGYQPDDPLRFNRRVTADCLHCHAGRVALEPNRESRYKSPPVLEAGIGCERCHGPGEEHVAHHEGRGGPDIIVNPAHLQLAERESVCDQCHLQAEARIPRYGRSHLDFRPGQKLAEVLSVLTFDHGPQQSARAVRHTQQMHASRCYPESRGAMGCTSCHDAHSVPKAGEKSAFYRQKCIACHATEPHCALPEPQRLARSSEDSCVECHMPGVAAADVGHTAQTDHRVLRDPAASPLAEEAPEVLPPLAFFEGMEAPLERWEADRALGLALFEHAAGRGDRPAQLRRIASLLAPALERAPDDPAALVVMGAVRLEQRHLDESRTHFNLAWKQDAQNEAALHGLANVAYAAGDRNGAVRWLDQLLAVNDLSGEIYARQAEIMGEFQQWDESIAAAERAIQRNPRDVSSRAWLVDAYRRVGRHDLANKQYDILTRMKTVWRGPHPGGSSKISN